MGFFSRERDISPTDVCHEFYNSQVFVAVIGNVDFSLLLSDALFKSVAEIEPSFTDVDYTLFHNELIAIRLEIFSLAWGHCFKQAEFGLAQTVFTKRYLEGRKDSTIWEAMGAYNYGLAESTSMTATGEPLSGRFGRAKKDSLNALRAGIFDKWDDVGIDHQCLARYANRSGVDAIKGDCVTVRLVASRLAERLDCKKKLSTEALIRLASAVFGFYKGSEDYLSPIKLRVTPPEISFFRS